jgi:hypothetical protein
MLINRFKRKMSAFFAESDFYSRIAAKDKRAAITAFIVTLQCTVSL